MGTESRLPWSRHSSSIHVASPQSSCFQVTAERLGPWDTLSHTHTHTHTREHVALISRSPIRPCYVRDHDVPRSTDTQLSHNTVLSFSSNFINLFHDTVIFANFIQL
jgi:hypothetical protein